jgi:hypothetical protein
MDYVFIPGETAAEKMGRKVFALRANSKLITTKKGQKHIQGFLKLLETSGSVTRPIGDIVLVAHGSPTADYFMSADAKHGSPTSFEDLVEVDASNSIRLNATHLSTGGGPLQVITVRVKGCNIGNSPQFIGKFEQAMQPAGGSLNMTAPKHFNEFREIKGGWVEYLAYDFRVTSKTKITGTPPTNPVKDRDAVIAAFTNKNFPLVSPGGGTPGGTVPAAAWKTWIPTNVHPAPAQWTQSFPYKVALSPAVGAIATAAVHREYRYTTSDPFTWSWKTADPGTQAGRLKILHDTLPQGTFRGVHAYDPDYPYPIYERYGFTDVDDYVNNLDWKVTFSKGTLHFRAVRHEYSVQIPIAGAPIAPSKDPTLTFYNFYPSKATSPPAATNLDETNAELYISI